VIGNNSIVASYSGDTNYQPSISSSVGVYVASSTLANSATTLTLSSTSVAPGDPFTFMATVSSNGPQPTGTITFVSDGQAVSGQLPLSLGVVSVSSKLVVIAPGAHLITAIYSGDANYQASASAPASFNILNGDSSTITVGLSAATVVQGSSILVTATILPASPIPGGTAELILDGNLYGQPTAVTGTTISLPLLTNTLQSGLHVIQITYSGDGAHLASTSVAAALSVVNPAGSFTLTPSTTSAITTQGKNSNAITLTVTATGSFTSTVTFACTDGLPSGAACTFAPATVAPVGPKPQTTVLTISSTAVASQTAKLAETQNLSRGIEVVLGGLFLFFLPRRTRRWSALTLLLVLSSLGVLSGCGRGGVDPNGASLLRTGTYAVTVSATGGSNIQAVTINFTVQ
jgi:Bacterial Ig-like domain (group 3)